jgi:hypothetical protein
MTLLHPTNVNADAINTIKEPRRFIAHSHTAIADYLIDKSFRNGTNPRSVLLFQRGSFMAALRRHASSQPKAEAIGLKVQG